MNDQIKILIVDDQALFREGLHTLLSVQNDFIVVGEAANGEEAIRMAKKHQPDVILMDLRMPILDGVSAVQNLRLDEVKSKVIILTTFDDDEYVFEGLQAGAVGYLLKDVSSDKLFEAVRAAARGEYFLMPSITTKVMTEFSRLSRSAGSIDPSVKNPLSNREMEILQLIATGASNREIADQLVITEGTVKNHVTNILAKLAARDRLHAVITAKEMGIL
jgi:DNA-binding NarL/FixJ family response regulator